MQYQFVGTAKLFNGRFWTTVDIRVQASSLPVALARAARMAMKNRPKGSRVSGMSITLERLGKVASQEEKQVRG